jgi:hypothetical protein
MSADGARLAGEGDGRGAQGVRADQEHQASVDRGQLLGLERLLQTDRVRDLSERHAAQGLGQQVREQPLLAGHPQQLAVGRAAISGLEVRFEVGARSAGPEVTYGERAELSAMVGQGFGQRVGVVLPRIDGVVANQLACDWTEPLERPAR